MPVAQDNPLGAYLKDRRGTLGPMAFGFPALRTALAASALALGAGPSAAEAPEPAPMYGAWGFDSAGMDTSVRPGDDFFAYANGAWLARAKIPPDKPQVTLRLEMTDRTEARLHELLQSLADAAPPRPDDLEGKVGAFYKSYMDEFRIEGMGSAPIVPQLAAVRKVQSHEQIAALMGHCNADFDMSLYSIVVDVDLRAPERYAVYLGQDGLGLPDRDYYLLPEFAKQRAAYAAYVEGLLGLIAWPQPRQHARQILEFETRVAQASWTKVQDRDIVATYNAMSVEELERLAPDFAWEPFLAAAGLPQQGRVVVQEASAFPKIAASFARTPVEVLQAWAAFHIADRAAPYLSKPVFDAWFGLHGRTLTGQAEPRARWKRAITVVGGDDFLVGERFGTFGTMGWGVGKLYTKRYFPPQAKAKIEALVFNLLRAYRVRLEQLDWMGAETKAEALRKLDTYVIKVGYPEHPRDYAAVEIADNDLVGNVLRLAADDWQFKLGRLPGPVDRSEWVMTPQTNDAYNGNLRDIVFPAGILQPPMFDPDADPAINYGAIGAVIGHELTHGFDDQGRKIDATGALRDWWSKDDAAKFEARAKKLAAQYDRFRPIAADPAVHVNGELTLGENIADLGGMTLALDAYRASLEGASAPVVGGLTGEQRVLLGWAQVWRGKASDEYIRRQVTTDPHSPRRYRVDGVVRNLDAWYEAFGVKAGDALFVAPAERVRIW